MQDDYVHERSGAVDKLECFFTFPFVDSCELWRRVQESATQLG